MGQGSLKLVWTTFNSRQRKHSDALQRQEMCWFFPLNIHLGYLKHYIHNHVHICSNHIKSEPGWKIICQQSLMFPQIFVTPCQCNLANWSVHMPVWNWETEWNWSSVIMNSLKDLTLKVFNKKPMLDLLKSPKMYQSVPNINAKSTACMTMSFVCNNHTKFEINWTRPKTEETYCSFAFMALLTITTLVWKRKVHGSYDHAESERSCYHRLSQHLTFCHWWPQGQTNAHNIIFYASQIQNSADIIQMKKSYIRSGINWFLMAGQPHRSYQGEVNK